MKNTKTKNKTKQQTPKTVQQSIPYTAAYSNGIIELPDGTYSRSYRLADFEFICASQEEQIGYVDHFGELLNMLDCQVEISVVNREMSRSDFRRDYLIPLKNDKLNKYREEINDILLAQIDKTHGLIPEKYLTLTIPAENILVAAEQFDRYDMTVKDAAATIGTTAVPCSIDERLHLLRDLYNPGCSVPYDFDFAHAKKSGTTSRDVIAPDSLFVQKDYIGLGDKYSSTLFIADYPPEFSTEVTADIAATSCKLIVSTHLKTIDQNKGIKTIRNQLTNINASIIEQQKRSARKGYSSELISPDLANAREEAMRLLDDLTSSNQKLFTAFTAVTIFADTKDELKQYVKLAQAAAQKYRCNLRYLNYQQEIGFNATLPLGYNTVEITRLFATDSAALFAPFRTESLIQKGGFYYGTHAITGNTILFNRLNSRNSNGVILGSSGSGKSFSAKREIFSVILGTDDDVYVIDPEREYAPLAELLGGEVIRIAAGSQTHINPLDMNRAYADEDNPITLKADYLCSICEIAATGGRYSLSPIQKSIIHRCVQNVYTPYMQYMAEHPEIASDKAKTPTLIDFYEMLLSQPEPEAQNVALALERYCTGTLDTFAHHTNVNTSARFVVYDIKDIGAGMKELGLSVCLNDIWNRTIENKMKGKRTWSYLDEFYLLTQTESSAAFLQQVFKRARKWGGVPTGITQDVEDLLQSPQSRGILNNCDFVMMLNQSPVGRVELTNMFNINETLQGHITNVPVGHGLLYTGSALIPFLDEYPQNTESFRVMNTKPGGNN